MIGEICPCCTYVDGHNLDTCPLVKRGKAKAMTGIPLKAGVTTIRYLVCRCGDRHRLSEGPRGNHVFTPISAMETFTDQHRVCRAMSGQGIAVEIVEAVEV